MIENTACFTGHRPEKMNFSGNGSLWTVLEQELTKVIVGLIESGITDFITGMAEGTDMLAAEIVLKLKIEHPGIRLGCYIPFPGQASRWQANERARYARIKEKADFVKTVCDCYTPFCMQMRNVSMVNDSLVVVAVYNGSAGGTENTVAYAERKKRRIILINPDELRRISEKNS